MSLIYNLFTLGLQRGKLHTGLITMLVEWHITDISFLTGFSDIRFIEDFLSKQVVRFRLGLQFEAHRIPTKISLLERNARQLL